MGYVDWRGGGPTHAMVRHGYRSGVYSIAISRDGTLIVSGDGYGIVRRWNLLTGEATGKSMDGHSDIMSAVVISNDRKLIVTGFRDKIILGLLNGSVAICDRR